MEFIIWHRLPMNKYTMSDNMVGHIRGLYKDTRGSIKPCFGGIKEAFPEEMPTNLR